MKVAVIGASENPARYSYLAIERLLKYNHEVFAFGLRTGEVHGVNIQTSLEPIPEIDTVTLYVGPNHQAYWMTFIAALKPRRIIFNPGTENLEFQKYFTDLGIKCEEACTLVLLQLNMFD